MQRNYNSFSFLCLTAYRKANCCLYLHLNCEMHWRFTWIQTWFRWAIEWLPLGISGVDFSSKTIDKALIEWCLKWFRVFIRDVNLPKNFLKHCCQSSFYYRIIFGLCSADCDKQRSLISHTFDCPEKSRAVAIDQYPHTNWMSSPVEPQVKCFAVVATLQATTYYVQHTVI